MSPDFAANRPFVLLTCEHGGNDIPRPYQPSFADAQAILESHRGYDPGALPVAQQLAASLALPLIFSTTTRLLVDLNRSLDQPDLFSEFTRDLPESERAQILTDHYTPHRTTVTRTVEAAITAAPPGNRVIHIGVHSCCDRLNNQDRDLDIALLFDESRPLETEFCTAWRNELERLNPTLRYPFNTPYNGADDGLTTTLRNRFKPAEYLGIEIELRQGFVRDPLGQRTASDLLTESLRAVLAPR